MHRTVTAIRNFMNPFRIPIPENPAEDRLYALHSGAPVPVAVEVDVKRAEALGKQQKMMFIEQRLKDGKKSFFDPINCQKLLTMDHSNKSFILSTSTGKGNYFLHVDYYAQFNHKHIVKWCDTFFFFFAIAAHPLQGAE